MSEEISANSNKEEIAEYFQKNFKITDEVKANLIKEDISGDILLDISDGDFNTLGVKAGPLLKIKRFLKKEEPAFKKTKDINVKITNKSSIQEVKIFLEKYINYELKSMSIDGTKLIQLNEEGMNELGLKLGQKKKLIKYINYFKTLPVEEENKESEEEIIIHRNSSKQDVSNFLRKKSHLSQEIIESLELDAEVLLDLKDDEIDDINELTYFYSK